MSSRARACFELIVEYFGAAFGCARQAVLNDNAQVDKGDNARLSSFVGAIAIADLVKSTLGPKGGYLLSGAVIIQEV